MSTERSTKMSNTAEQLKLAMPGEGPGLPFRSGMGVLQRDQSAGVGDMRVQDGIEHKGKSECALGRKETRLPRARGVRIAVQGWASRVEIRVCGIPIITDSDRPPSEVHKSGHVGKNDAYTRHATDAANLVSKERSGKGYREAPSVEKLELGDVQAPFSIRSGHFLEL